MSVFRGALPFPNPHASSERALLSRLLTRGTLVVAAAGNTPAPSEGANTVWEAAYPETLSVAGSSWRGPDARAGRLPGDIEKAARVSRLLTELGVPHALIGGLAVGVHGHPRATKSSKRSRA